MTRTPFTAITLITLFAVLPACAKQDAAPASQAPAASAAAVAPDSEKLAVHFRDHMELPADRDAILAACANTPEFTEEEKQWVAENLPEGTYASPEAIMEALGIE